MGFVENQWLLNKLNGQHGFLEFTEAGTFEWICPTGVSMVYVVAQGGNGGGGGGSGGSLCNRAEGYARGGPGGASGGTAPIVNALLSVESGQSYPITVGAGGAGGTGGARATSAVDVIAPFNGAGGTSGANGEQTKFGDILATNGGGGGGGGIHTAKINSGGFSSEAGLAGTLDNSIYKFVIFNIAESSSGNKGSGVDLVSNGISPGGAGGASKYSPIGSKSGAGGAGGTGGNTASGTSSTDGSPGGDGDCGYMKIIW